MAEHKLSYTASEIDERLGKVDSLVSSVNGVSPDESGNVTIDIGTSITVDSELSETSTNPVQNKVVYETFYNLNDSLTTKFSSIDEEFETMQNEIDNLSASGCKELLGEITLDSTNITASTTAGRYNYGTDLSTTMTEILSKVDNDGYEPIITELTMTDTTFYALSHYCSGGTNAMKNIQCSIVYGADELRNFCFGENQMITNESEAINYVISGALTINVKFYKVSGGNGSANSENSSSTGALVGEIVLNSTNITKGNLSYAFSEEVSTQMSNIINSFVSNNKTPVTDVIYGDTTLHSNNGATICYEDLSLLSISFGTFGALEFIGNEMHADNMLETIVEQMLTDNGSVSIRFHESAGGAQPDWNQNDSSASDYIKNRPFYKETETVFDGDVTTVVDDHGITLYSYSPAIIDLGVVQVGDIFDVMVDNVMYSCEYKSNKIPYIGNLYMYFEQAASDMGMATEEFITAMAQNMPEVTELAVDTGEPFILMLTDTSTDFCTREAGTYHFIINGVTNIKKLDSSMIDWAGGGAPSGLPEVTTEDNDKVLMVVDGKWTLGSIANGDEVAY